MNAHSPAPDSTRDELPPAPQPGGGWVLRQRPSHSKTRGVSWWQGAAEDGRLWTSVPNNADGADWDKLPVPLASAAVFASEQEVIDAYVTARGSKPPAGIKPQRLPHALVEWHSLMGTQIDDILGMLEEATRMANAAKARATKLKALVNGLPMATYGDWTLMYQAPRMIDDAEAIKAIFGEAGPPKRWSVPPMKVVPASKVTLADAVPEA